MAEDEKPKDDVAPEAPLEDAVVKEEVSIAEKAVEAEAKEE